MPTLSEADLAKAKERYAEALGKNTENAEGLDLFKFKGAVIVLCLSENLTLPSEKDLNMAFETADLDKSGFVDEAEVSFFQFCSFLLHRCTGSSFASCPVIRLSSGSV